MKFSWSHKLFFKINKQIGKRKWLDKFMIFCAHYLLFLLIIFGALVIIRLYRLNYISVLFILFIGLIILTAVMTSWIFGYFFPHKRPVIEFPETKQLIRPWKTWKALPSDHATISFIIALAVGFLVGWNIIIVLTFLTCAVLVSIGRVYTGLHYPRDVLAGFVLAILYSFIFWITII